MQANTPDVFSHVFLDLSGGNSDTYSNRKCQVHESVQMTKMEKSSLKKTLSGSGSRGDYYPTPYATTRISAEEQKEQAARQSNLISEQKIDMVFSAQLKLKSHCAALNQN
ncbi:hypothetical protein AVEN_21490-1 [Araneus ventricosus]|uniref:Uncharacterized protein n=1 Tax=Araneus ventricosus TaxID=182803 RepID=A0A4Y2EQD1_ARAVE|nr:hypothetical protein AVEN_21490-1 [Araneus ventricosus]